MFFSDEKCTHALTMRKKREEKKTNNVREARSMSAELKRKFIKLMFQSHRIELNAKITAL